jgi:hypothetical protein
MSLSVNYSGSEATTAPTLETQGLSLKGLKAYRVIVSADETRTISNTSGTLECYLYSEALSRWMRARTTFDVAVNTSGVRDLPSDGDFTPVVSSGRVFFKVNGVTVSAGGLTVTIEGVQL